MVFGGALVGASFDKAVFAQFLLYLVFALVLELHDDTISCEQVLVLVETDEHGTSYGPGCAVGGTRIPRQGEEVTTGDLHAILMDDTFDTFIPRRVLSFLERTIEIKTVHLPLTLTFGDNGHQAAQHRVGLRGLVVGAVGPILDGKGAETDGIVFGKNITGLCTIGLRTTYLGNEERVIGQCILARP